ncbi:MAG TPA: DUF1499 domain-containing protein [Longimicrobiaceae bacterium]|nr:DUF1499 domain-containing protein [Longimicrobiaceae bacterium]
MTTTYQRHRPGHTDLGALAEERPLSRFALAAFALALVAGAMVLAAGPGTRAGWWDFRTGFSLLRWGAYLGILAAVVCLAAAVRSWRMNGRWLALAGVAIALVAVLVPWSFRRGASGAPPIHDVTTDTRNPPAFVAVAPLRADAPNPVAYEGEAVAAQQRQAYPDIGPVMMTAPQSVVFDDALAAAREMGWEIVDSSREQGRIEATATTTWFGFKDDVVIRVMPASGVTRVDVRSKSRVGRGDAGANAARVRGYLERLRNRRPLAVVEAG